MGLPARAAVTLTCAALAVAVAGCKGHTTYLPGSTVTVEKSTTSVAGSSSSSGASPSTPSSSASTTLSIPSPVALGAPTSMSKLPGPCDNLLPDTVVSRAVGGFSFDGDTQFVVGLPDRKSGRVSYLDCRYGVDAQAAQLEIYVGLYQTAARAKARIAPTVSDFADHGAGSTATSLSGFPASLLTGGTDTGYGPTLVMAYGQRTVAITFADGVLPSQYVTPALKSVAALAAKRTS